MGQEAVVGASTCGVDEWLKLTQSFADKRTHDLIRLLPIQYVSKRVFSHVREQLIRSVVQTPERWYEHWISGIAIAEIPYRLEWQIDDRVKSRVRDMVATLLTRHAITDIPGITALGWARIAQSCFDMKLIDQLLLVYQRMPQYKEWLTLAASVQ